MERPPADAGATAVVGAAPASGSPLLRSSATGGAGGRPATGSQRRLVAQRLAAAALVAVVVPLIVALGAASDGVAIRVGEPAPRTILADREVRAVDAEATETARQTAAATVAPVVVDDRDAQSAIVLDAREIFRAARDVRQPVSPGGDLPARRPSQTQEVEALTALEPVIDRDLGAALVALSDGDLEVVERETIAIAQALARQSVDGDGLQRLLDDTVPFEVALRSLPGSAGEDVVDPLLRLVMRPTVRVDLEETDAARARAAGAVEDVAQVWLPGQAIVREGEIVDSMAFQGIEELGQTGASALRTWLRASIAMLLVVAVGGVYLSRMQPIVWVTGKKLLLLGILVTAYAVLVSISASLVEATSPAWLYAVPAGALAMLVALLVHPVIGIATMLPAAVLVLLAVPTAAPVALFAAAAVLVSVPLTTRIAKRSDLRSATLRAGLSYPVIAAGVVVVFGPRDGLVLAVAAGALNGLITAIAVQGAMPFLENLFRLPTVTALLDLSDRNHPLLRELETKALGTYNHSVMVAALTERACRAIGADALLGGVAALYHDIGKVRQPHYFIENQQGIGNPHDDLEPEVSAIIIQNHVIDGVEMATEHRLPPEVVACIGSHHGTMLVSFFYNQALAAAGGDPTTVDEERYRYKGHKPRGKEAAVLLLADCCEATTRAMAMSRGNLPREEIEATVDRLLRERVDDGQFDESALTFRELGTVRDTIVESLVGIYHPRIAYPKREQLALEQPERDAGEPDDAAAAPRGAADDASSVVLPETVEPRS